MEGDNQQITPDQFLLQALKRQMGERFANYEEAIAGMQTQLAMAEQTINELRSKDAEEATDVVEEG